MTLQPQLAIASNGEVFREQPARHVDVIHSLPSYAASVTTKAEPSDDAIRAKLFKSYASDVYETIDGLAGFKKLVKSLLTGEMADEYVASLRAANKQTSPMVASVEFMNAQSARIAALQMALQSIKGYVDGAADLMAYAKDEAAA